MDFASIVLIERDKNNNFIRELDSYKACDGAQYIRKFYYDGEKINVVFDTNEDVEEWQFNAIFDNFQVEVFEKENFKIEEVEDSYNPTWKIVFDYKDDYSYIEEKINQICTLIFEEMKNVYKTITDKEEEYK